jgi:hypothetical protein
LSPNSMNTRLSCHYYPNPWWKVKAYRRTNAYRGVLHAIIVGIP